MTGKQLKNSILQWAIQGKLVPQDPNDEPASVLLEKIRAEKARLVKEGKLKKKDLEVKPITEEEIPFEIPNGWKWCRIKEIFSMQAGKFVSANDISDEETHEYKYPCYGGNGLRGYVKKYNNEGHFTLVGRQGALCGNVQIANGQFYATEHAVVTDGFGQTDVNWAFYFLKASNLNQYATATAQPGLAVSNILEVLIPLPPLAEQYRIVAKIEELMPLVEKYGAAQDALDEWNQALPEKLKKSILQEAIQGKLVPQDSHDEPASVLLERIREEKQRLVKEGKLKKKDLEVKPIEEDEIPFEIPRGWKWFRLSDLANMYTGNSISETEKKAKYTGVKGMEYIGTKDVSFEHVIDYANGIAIPDRYMTGFKIAPAKSILLCVEGGSAGRKIGILNRNVCFGNKLCCFDTFIYVNRFLYYYLQSPMFREVFKNNVNGIIGGVSINTMKSLLVPLPPLAEQRRIVAKIEELFGVLNK